MKRFLIPLLAALVLSAPAANAADISLIYSPYGAPYTGGVLMGDDDQGLHIDGQDILIDNHQGDQARIAADGSLSVNGKPVTVTGPQKTMLQRYNRTVMDLKVKGIELGKHAAGFAMRIVGEAIAAVFSGDSEADISRRTNAEVENFKLKALPICEDVQVLKRLQDRLAAEIPAFQPFSVIESKDADDCEHDLKSDG